MAESKLTAKQELFIAEYLIDFNATQAYIRAGYKARGSSATVNANRLLTNANILGKIQANIDKMCISLEIQSDQIVRELMKIAFSDIKDYITTEDGYISIKDLEDIDTSALDQIEVRTRFVGTDSKDKEKIQEQNVKIKLNSKTKALEMLGRYLAMFTDKIQHSGNVTFAEAVLEIRKGKGDSDN